MIAVRLEIYYALKQPNWYLTSKFLMKCIVLVH